MSYSALFDSFEQGRKRPFINGVSASEAVLIYKAADRVLKYGRPLINNGAVLFFRSISRP